MNLKDYCIARIPEKGIILKLKKLFVCPNCHSEREVGLEILSSFCGCGYTRELSSECVFEMFPLVENKELFFDITNDQIIELNLEGLRK